MALIFQAASVLLFVLISSGDLCPQGGDVAIHKDYKSGVQLCCQTIRCERGYEAVVCRSDNPYSTTCRPCPENTFQPEFTSSVDMMPCSIKQFCREGMKVEYNVSSVKDRKCICDVQLGLCNSSKSRSQFCQLGNCSAGLQLNPDCSCTDCESGFFKETNGSSRCRRWKNCEEEGLETLSEGSATTDRVCGAQHDGAPKLSQIPPPSTSPSPSESVSTNSNVTSDLPNTTEMVGRSGDIKPIIAGIVIVIGIVLLAIALALWFAKPKLRLPCKKQPSVAVHVSGLDAETGANGRNEENSTFIRSVEMEPRENPVVEEQRLLRTSAQQIIANGNTVHQPPTLHTGGIERQVDPPIQQNNTDRSNGASGRDYDWTEKLNACRVHLVSKICYSPEFIAYFMVNNTITEDMKEIIEAEKTNMRKTDKLMYYLPRRPSYAFPTLILALVLTGQSHLAERVDADMAVEFQANQDHLHENHAEVLESFCTSYT